jgi:exodeoxyribonuclease VII small subunit
MASFREELERLEVIVRSLEQEDLDLDRALELFEEGVTRLKAARELLQQSELTVKRVLEAADGTLRTSRADL